MVHVLTGPDHLSALATLSANVGNYHAFWYGVRWGVGHSIGLVVVGSFFIIISNVNGDGDTVEVPESVEAICESFVGIFMFALGSFSLVNAFNKRRNGASHNEYGYDGDDEIRHSMMGSGTDARGSTRPGTSYQSTPSSSTAVASRSAMMRRTPSDQSVVSISHQTIAMDGNARSSTKSLRPSIFQDEDDDENDLARGAPQQGQRAAAPLPFQIGEASFSLNADGSPDEFRKDHGHSHAHDEILDKMDSGFSKQFLSVGIGIVHGVAGPGGVLGVIPAVQLHNLWHSIVYLGSFCITSTLTMGCFAAAYGICSSGVSSNSDTLAFRMEVFSASLSVLVGWLWLTLLYLGILHDIFP